MNVTYTIIVTFVDCNEQVHSSQQRVRAYVRDWADAKKAAEELQQAMCDQLSTRARVSVAVVESPEEIQNV